MKEIFKIFRQEVLSKFNFNIPRVNVRSLHLFYQPPSRINISRNAPISRMCRVANYLTALDCFKNSVIACRNSCSRHVNWTIYFVSSTSNVLSFLLDYFIFNLDNVVYLLKLMLANRINLEHLFFKTDFISFVLKKLFCITVIRFEM